MGRIKTTLIKRTTLKLYKDHKDRFKNDFEHNKGVVDELLITSSKKLRNIIAGYATRLVKQEKK
ncbi:MAG: 30S ribosomal protein S17e [Candidatus Woesearchaeota archaeon]|nr:30S ribosomal protein S17e [Candidatus Woesearchaeota archaeon]